MELAGVLADFVISRIWFRSMDFGFMIHQNQDFKGRISNVFQKKAFNSVVYSTSIVVK